MEFPNKDYVTLDFKTWQLPASQKAGFRLLLSIIDVDNKSWWLESPFFAFFWGLSNLRCK